MNKVDKQGSKPLFYSNADGLARKANEVIVCVAEHSLNLSPGARPHGPWSSSLEQIENDRTLEKNSQQEKMLEIRS